VAAGTLGVLSHQGASNLVAGTVLIGAGAFQFAPVKHACLAHCRNPLSYLLSAGWTDRSAAFDLASPTGPTASAAAGSSC
jgi:predicted metal-binding membrane protein